MVLAHLGRVLLPYWFLATLFVYGICLCDVVAADDLPRTAVMRPQVSQADALRSLNAAIENVLRAKVKALGVVDISGVPFAKMDDLQLVVGCLSDTPECYRAVARQLSVDAFILTNLDQPAPDTLLTVSFVDTRDQGKTKHVQRRFGPEETESDIINALEDMLRELFDFEPKTKQPPPPKPKPEIIYKTAPATDGESGGSPVVPVLVGVAGLGLAAGGVVFALLASSTEDEYASAPTSTRQEVNAALDLKSKGDTQGLLATTFFLAGGAAIATAVLLYILLDNDEAGEVKKDVAVGPVLGPSQLGVALSGNLELW